jgi:hypothetical protein
MHRSLPTFFQRLRRHRGGWMLLIAALMIKVAASTACVLDGPKPIVDAVSVGQVTALADDGDLCFLGESGDCHCSCAHAVALPTTMPSVATIVALPGVMVHLPAPNAPLAQRSPLRPPIA